LFRFVSATILVKKDEYIIQPFLPQKPDLSYNLRERTHNRSLITKTIDLFIELLIRMLYWDW